MLQTAATKILTEDYVVKDTLYSVEDGVVTKSFVVDILVPGKYYLSAWLQAAEGAPAITSLQVFLDSEDEPVGRLQTRESGWQSAALLSPGEREEVRRVRLSFGTHVFSLRTAVPEVPNVEFLRLSRRRARAASKATAYRRLVKRLGACSLPSDYEERRQLLPSEDLADSAEEYVYRSGLSFAYTFYRTFYFTAGTTVKFETKKANPCASDPYMYLFRLDAVSQATWANDDGGAGYQSKLTVKIPTTGYYCLLIRAYNSAHPGTSDLWKDGALYVAGIPLAGTKVYCGNVVTSDYLNFFTAQVTGDTRLWLQSYYTGNGIVAFNDDYHGAGDFQWGLSSRVRAKVYRIRYAIVSAYSSYSPQCKCDLYAACRDSTITSHFPNLKADDAIRSAPTSSAYNCISWAGGRDDLGRYFWPPNAGNPWHGSSDLQSFDNFFGNRKNGQSLPRSNGAMNYKRSGANAGNAAVALWKNSGGYTHGSVKKPGDDHPHGYDWESKPGGLMRTFHPRDGLNGSSYGQIVAYYRWDGTRTYGTPPMDRARRGPRAMEAAMLEQNDRETLFQLVANVPGDVREEFERRYLAWKETWQAPELEILSDPRATAASDEYRSLLAFCKEHGNTVWALLFERYELGDELVISAIEDLTFEDYSHLMEESVAGGLTRADSVVPTQAANWTKYIQRVLGELGPDE